MKPEKTTVPVYVGFKCSPALKAALKKLAADDCRDLSNYIRLVLEKHVKNSAAAAREDRA